MPGRQDDDLARRADRGGRSSVATPPSRSLALGTAVALAVVATIVAFLTDDLTVLRGAVVVAAWSVVAAAYVAVRQLAESRIAAGREQELRRAYDRELDLEAAAHREHELEVENDLRREADEALRAELGPLRGQIAELTRLREQLARVSGLGDSLAGLARLREDVAALGALRGDVAALSRLHEDVGQLGELRDELAALRSELSEKIDAELLVERILLRTRGFRAAAPTEETAAPTAAPVAAPEALSWTDEQPHELTGGWPAVRLDAAPPTREYETLGREGAWEPVTVERSASAPEPTPEPRHARHGAPRHGSAAAEPDRDEADRHEADRFEADRFEPQAWRDDLLADDEPAASPLEWLADHSLLHPLDQPWTTPTAAVPVSGPRHGSDPELPGTGPLGAQGARPVPFRRRRDDELGPPTDPASAATTEHPARHAGARPPLPSYGTPPQPDTAGHGRLSEIMGDAGATAAGRRRRRYREDGETDDVLSRVLRGE